MTAEFGVLDAVVLGGTAIAHEFRSVDVLAETDQAEIADRVHGAGSSTGDGLASRF